MQVRRVVTGHNEAGKAVVISDGFLPSISPDEGDKWSVWAADRPVTFPDGGDPPPFGGPLLPRPGGFDCSKDGRACQGAYKDVGRQPSNRRRSQPSGQLWNGPRCVSDACDVFYRLPHASLRRIHIRTGGRRGSIAAGRLGHRKRCHA